MQFIEELALLKTTATSTTAITAWSENALLLIQLPMIMIAIRSTTTISAATTTELFELIFIAFADIRYEIKELNQNWKSIVSLFKRSRQSFLELKK